MTDTSHYREVQPGEWSQNPCGCRNCNVCSFFGHAPKLDRKPPPKPEPARKVDPTLFDEEKK